MLPLALARIHCFVVFFLYFINLYLQYITYELGRLLLHKWSISKLKPDLKGDMSLTCFTSGMFLFPTKFKQFLIILSSSDQVCFKWNSIDMEFCNFLVETRPKAKEQVCVVVCLFNCCVCMFSMINIGIN